jgi:putative acetyltransferase
MGHVEILVQVDGLDYDAVERLFPAFEDPWTAPGSMGEHERARRIRVLAHARDCSLPLVAGLIIRPETGQDHAAVAKVTAAAFGKQGEARMVDAIRRSDGFVPELSLVAELEGAVVGHVMLSYVELGEGSRGVLELGPMSVAPEHQRNGIGSALVEEALRRADERGEPLVLVLGHPTYYPRFGFRPASELGLFPSDPRIRDEAFMAIPLRGYDPTLRGRVVFPPAFS